MDTETLMLLVVGQLSSDMADTLRTLDKFTTNLELQASINSDLLLRVQRLDDIMSYSSRMAHTFIGRLDRDCLLCNKPDRNANHA